VVKIELKRAARLRLVKSGRAWGVDPVQALLRWGDRRDGGRIGTYCEAEVGAVGRDFPHVSQKRVNAGYR
jgi:hypothetical protein